MSKDLAFEARHTKLLDVLFTTHKKFMVPRYQRPYSWTEDQVSDFWNDLISDDTFRFMGSLILNKEKLTTSGYYEIVDGQQRLLTITIFCAALRDALKEIDAEKAKIFHRHDITIEDINGNLLNRIEPSESLKSFFQQNIQHIDSDMSKVVPSSREESLVKKNYEFFMGALNGAIKSYSENSKKIDYLLKMRSRVQEMPVILIEVSSEDDAYDIFETTNARGIDLSVADLLKNMIFSQLKETGEKDIAKEYWNEIVTNVQETDTEMKKFIRYFWISKYSFVYEKKLYKSIKNTITDWEKLLFDIHEASKWYDKLFIGHQDAWEDIKHGEHIYDSLAVLRISSISQCHVLFLSILRNLENLGTDPKRVFQWIESFSFKYSTICKLPTNKLEKIYSSYARKIEGTMQSEDKKAVHKKIQGIFEELKKELKREEPGFEQFKEAFSEVSYGKSEKNRLLCRYILSKINSIDQPQEFKFKSINIEHILPQKPDKKWNLNQKDIKGYVNRLGNLTLIHKKINSTIGNKIVSEKLDELSKSGVVMTNKLVDVLKGTDCKWNEETINNRHNELAEVAYYQAWKIE